MIELKKKVKILLVEDNMLNQKLMFFNLSKMGFDLTIANHGQDAVDIYKEQFFDLILMDIMMPEMDGFEATSEIRNIEKTTGNKAFIIGLTANVLNSDRDKCLSGGMNEFLPKPFDIDEFCSMLKKLDLI